MRELPAGLLGLPIFLNDISFLKATLWLDLGLFERAFPHPINTEDWMIALLWKGEDVNLKEMPKMVRKDLLEILAQQVGMGLKGCFWSPLIPGYIKSL